jgi:hypothetical protein
MAKTDFKPVMIRNVEFLYPRLNATYKFNTAEKRSEECNPRAQGASYSIGWKMDKDAAQALHSELKAHYESCKTNPPFSKVFGMKKLEDGSFTFSAKRNGCNGQGDENSKPNVIDGMKQPLADTAIWGGSKGSIKVIAFPVTDPEGNGGVSLLIDTVQVTHAVYGGAGLDDFDEVPMTSSGNDGLDEFEYKPAPAEAKAPIADSVSLDEIPF